MDETLRKTNRMKKIAMRKGISQKISMKSKGSLKSV
jgi:hypothetical protein